MEYRWLIGLTAALAFGACKTTNSAQTGTAQQAEESAEASIEESPEPAATAFSAPALDGAPSAVNLAFIGGQLRVSRADGSYATWSGADASSTEAGAAREDSVPLAWSHDGALAIVDGTPPVIVRVDDGKEVLRFVKVESVEIAGFFPDGSGLYVGEPGGELHVWNESVDTLTSVPTENLESFIARQSPSFSANFSSLSGDATVTGSNELLLGTRSGKLYWWDPESPTKVKTLVKLPAAIRDTAYAGGMVFATTESGDFRAAKTSSGVFLEWSRGVSADYVAAASDAPSRVLVADGTAVRLLDTNDGTEAWRRALPGGAEVCGLAMSEDGQTGAVCINGGVVVFDTEGSVVGTVP